MVIESYASFRIMGSALRSAWATDELSLVPDLAHDMGDVHPGYKPWREGLWSLSSKERLTSVDLDEHLRLLLDLLEPSSEQLRRLVEDESLRTDFFCFVCTDGQGGPALPPQTLARIAALGAELTVDIYFDPGDDL